MNKEIPISELVKMDFDDAFNEKNCYGFLDWFCKESSLRNRAKRLFPKLKSLFRSYRFDPPSTYVFFKNNCGFNGEKCKLYDDFRICDIDNGGVLYTITPKNIDGDSEIWGKNNDFAEPLCKGSWK